MRGSYPIVRVPPLTRAVRFPLPLLCPQVTTNLFGLVFGLLQGWRHTHLSLQLSRVVVENRKLQVSSTRPRLLPPWARSPSSLVILPLLLGSFFLFYEAAGFAPTAILQHGWQ